MCVSACLFVCVPVLIVCLFSYIGEDIHTSACVAVCVCGAHTVHTPKKVGAGEDKVHARVRIWRLSAILKAACSSLASEGENI